MKRMKRFFRSVRMRSILIFLSCLFPLFSIGTGIFLWGGYTIETQYKMAQADRIDFLVDNLEADIHRLLSLQYDFFSDVDLNRLTDTLDVMSNYDRDMCVIDIENRLETIRASSRYVKELSVFIPTIGKSISASKISDLTETQMDLIRQFSEDSAPVSRLDRNTVYLYISVHRGYNEEAPELPKYALFTELSSRELSLSLDALLQEKEQEEYICAGNNGDFLLSSLEQDKARDWWNILAEQGQLPDDQGNTCELNGVSYYIRTTEIEPFGLTYISLLPEKVLYRPMSLFMTLFALFSIATVIVIFLFSRYIKRCIHSPLVRLLDAFRAVKSGDFQTFIRHSSTNEFSYIYDEFNSMTQQLEHLTGQVYKHQLLAQQAELRQLQAQINPHFLFNSFFILRRRIRDGDTERSMEMANALGEYFQFITRTASACVPLSEEVRHARIYTQIQSARFGSRISLDFAPLPEPYGSLMVERLILQPMIENAFEYGLEGLRSGGCLRVSFRQSEGMLSILVEDNGENLTDEKLESLRRLLDTTADEINDNEMEITGILNIHRRIRYRMGPKSGVYVRRSELGGLLAELRLTAELPERR